jgi:hypothetical protein
VERDCWIREGRKEGIVLGIVRDEMDRWGRVGWEMKNKKELEMEMEMEMLLSACACAW